MKKSTFEAGLAMAEKKVSANTSKTSIRFSTAEVVKILGLETAEQVADVVNFTRRNRAISDVVEDAEMVKFFGDEAIIATGVTGRLTAEAYQLFTSGKTWADRKKAV